MFLAVAAFHNFIYLIAAELTPPLWTLVAGSTKHRAVADELLLAIELRWGRNATKVAGGGIPHEEFTTHEVEDEDAPVADAEQVPAGSPRHHL